LNLGSRSNLNDDDRRLSEIINSYLHIDPPKETLAQKLKGKVSTLSASLHRSKNPFIGSNDEEIFSALENLYQQSVFEDLSVCDDPYERVLKIFRDHSNWPQFSDKKLFLNCCQAMRLRVFAKPDVYMTVCYIQDAFLKNRENQKKNRQRDDQFEPQADIRRAFSPLKYIFAYLLVCFEHSFNFAVSTAIFCRLFGSWYIAGYNVFLASFYFCFSMMIILRVHLRISHYLIQRREILVPQAWGDWKVKHEVPEEIAAKLDDVTDNVAEALK